MATVGLSLQALRFDSWSMHLPC